jgi:hypothetical protein
LISMCRDCFVPQYDGKVDFTISITNHINKIIALDFTLLAKIYEHPSHP